MNVYEFEAQVRVATREYIDADDGEPTATEQRRRVAADTLGDIAVDVRRGGDVI